MLFDVPGPRSRRRYRIYGVVALVIVALGLLWLFQRLDDTGQFNAAKWKVFSYSQVRSDLFAGLRNTLKAFALGSVVWDTTLQRKVPADKPARVASYAWMGAMVFLPAGYALAGPIAALLGIKAYLVIAAAWIIASTLFVIRLPAVREVGFEDEPDAVPVAAQ